MASTLELVLLYLVAAVLGVVVCRSMKLPPVLGYLVVGVLIGPNALALAKDTAGVKYLAEFGVVFLMFVIGWSSTCRSCAACANWFLGWA